MHHKKLLQALAFLASLNSFSCATATDQRSENQSLDVDWRECVKEVPKEPETPTVAYPRTQDFSWMPKNEWCARVKNILNDPARREAQLAFLGDSITQMWPKAELETSFVSYKPLKLGIGGDKTQSLLWRMNNGELRDLSLKNLVLLIGTNNLGSGDSPEAVAQGIERVIDQIRQNQPQAHIILMAIFPRGEFPSDPLRGKIKDTNQLLSASAKKWNVELLDIGPQLLEKDGTISKEMMSDYVHLTPKGYQFWRDSVLAVLKKSRADRGLDSAA